MFENLTKRAIVVARRDGVRIISAFPGTGKSHFTTQVYPEVLDSDSSTFPKDKFPTNYLDHIEQSLADGKLLVVSSHADVRRELVARGISFALLYPNEDCLEEYLQRYRQRGSPPAFVAMIEKHWSAWLQSCRDQAWCHRVMLTAGQYLSDRVWVAGKTFVVTE